MKSTLIFLFALISANALAESPAVYEKSFDQNLDAAYPRVYKALEGNGFKIVYEIDIQENLTKFAAKNAVKDFNLSQLEGIKSMVFCNGPSSRENQQCRPHDAGIVSAASDPHTKSQARHCIVCAAGRHRPEQQG